MTIRIFNIFGTIFVMLKQVMTREDYARIKLKREFKK